MVTERLHSIRHSSWWRHGIRSRAPAGMTPLPACEEGRSGCLSALAEIEHAGGTELAPLDQAESHQVALAGCIGGARWQQVVAAHEDGLTAQQPHRLLAADPEHGQIRQGL